MVLVVITQLLEQGGGGLGRGRLVVGDAVHAEVVVYNVGDGLGVSGGAGAAAPDGVVDLRQLVCDPVRDVGARCCARVGAQNHALVEVDGHSWEGFRKRVRWWKRNGSRRTWRSRGWKQRRVSRRFSFTEVEKLKRGNILDFALFQVVHVDMYPIWSPHGQLLGSCSSGSFGLFGEPSLSIPVAKVSILDGNDIWD